MPARGMPGYRYQDASLAQKAHVHGWRIASTHPCTPIDAPAPAELDILTLSTRRMRYG